MLLSIEDLEALGRQDDVDVGLLLRSTKVVSGPAERPGALVGSKLVIRNLIQGKVSRCCFGIAWLSPASRGLLRQARPRVIQLPPSAARGGGRERVSIHRQSFRGGGREEASKGDAVLENIRDDNYALQVIAGLQLNEAHAPRLALPRHLKRELSPENHGL